MSKLTVEIITLKEALIRIGLEDLLSEEDSSEWGRANYKVGWTGYPKPFSCGHTAVYGFGPLDKPNTDERHGDGRRYQSRVRISQSLCSGHVLFSWALYSTTGSYQLNSSVVISIDETPDSKDTCLRLGFTA